MNKQSFSDEDIKLCYFGGSGGFIVLHLLLLSGQFFCEFEDQSASLDKIVQDQWSIKNPRTWKASEYWPDNLITRDSKTTLRKIYLFCNPTPDMIKDFAGSVVVVYLGADAHMKMAHYKHANKSYFYNRSTSLYINHFSFYRTQLKKWINHYNNIKDPSWPKCLSPRKFHLLPSHIQDGLLKNPFTSDLIKIREYIPLDTKNREQLLQKLLSEKGVLVDGTEVRPEVYDFFQHADIKLKLTDIINDLDLLFDITKAPTNRAQVDLRNRWVSLHPPSLLNDVGIKLHKDLIPHAEQSRN